MRACVQGTNVITREIINKSKLQIKNNEHSFAVTNTD